MAQIICPVCNEEIKRNELKFSLDFRGGMDVDPETGEMYFRINPKAEYFCPKCFCLLKGVK